MTIRGCFPYNPAGRIAAEKKWHEKSAVDIEVNARFEAFAPCFHCSQQIKMDQPAVLVGAYAYHTSCYFTAPAAIKADHVPDTNS